ncbi:MAG: hypothetical protein ACR2JU_11225 [Nocardioidaceae bacterium]
MKNIVGLSVGALMCATALAGCGGSDSSSANSYCGDVKSAKTQFQGLSGADVFGQNFAELNAAVHTIADEAPSDVKASWTLLGDQFDSLKSAMDKAGVSMDDFSKLTQGDTSGIDPAKLAELSKTLQSFDTAGITAASDKITAEVKKECGIDMNSGSSTP